MDLAEEPVAQALIRDLDGQPHALAELWSERPALLVFLRHFGCMFCREQALALHRERDAIEARGARLVFIGVGNRHFAEGFRRELGLTVPLYVDTARNSYRALGMKRGVFATLLSRATWRNLVRAWRSGSRQKGVKGDPWQQGGVLLVLPGGRIAYRFLSQAAGDHPPLGEVLARLPPP